MPTKTRSRKHLTVVPPLSGNKSDGDFPPHLRPVAQVVWEILSGANPNTQAMSREARVEVASRHLEVAPSLTESERDQIWKAVTDNLASQAHLPPSSTSFGSRPSTTSASTSPPRTSSSGSPPAPATSGPDEKVPWTQPPDFNWIEPDDYPEFVADTTRRMIVLLNAEMQNLGIIEQQLSQQGMEEHRLVIEKKITVLNLIRLECIELNLMNLPPESGDLVVPDNRLLDSQGRPLGSNEPDPVA